MWPRAQTAHDAPYLVKHLLHGLPPVQQRVAEMRAGRAPGPASAQAAAEMEESQVQCLTWRSSSHVVDAQLGCFPSHRFLW